MDAKELRIGNIVWDDYSGNMIVYGIVTGGINPRVELRKSEKLPSGSYLVEAIKPIPLTEELLLKFGFVNVHVDHRAPNHKAFEKEAMHLKIYYTGQIGIWWINQHITTITTKVHQLQNLYFALTGEELTIIEQTLPVKG